MKLILSLFLTITLFSAFHRADAAFHGYVMIVGSKQGLLKGQGEKIGRQKDGWVEILDMDMIPDVPPASPNPHVPRPHPAVKITKQKDDISAKLLQALMNKEELSKVIIQYTRIGANGKEEIYRTVTLTGAHITDVKSNGDKENITVTWDLGKQVAV